MNYNTEKKIINTYYNGEYVNYDDVKIGLFSNSLNYGTGVIESIRCNKKGDNIFIIGLDEYIDRFLGGLEYRGYEIKETKNDIKKIIIKLLLLNKESLDSPYLRLIVYIGDNLNTVNVDLNFCASITNLFVPVKPLKGTFSSFYRAEDKGNIFKLSSNYSKNIIDQLKARKNGYDAVLFLGENGEILEGLSENIFVIKGNKIYTPKTGNIVDGVRRRLIISSFREMGYDVEEKIMNKDFLLDANEVFFSGSATGIRNFNLIEDKQFKEDFTITNKLRTFLENDIFNYKKLGDISISKII